MEDLQVRPDLGEIVLGGHDRKPFIDLVVGGERSLWWWLRYVGWFGHWGTLLVVNVSSSAGGGPKAEVFNGFLLTASRANLGLVVPP
jgi:hypothetical protein